jgi:hypothetical protein
VSTGETDGRTFGIGNWLIAGSLAAILPLIIFSVVLNVGWDFVPPWAWTTISIIPIASAVLLLLRLPQLPRLPQLAGGVLAIHAMIMVAMIAFKLWTAIAWLALVIDLLLIPALVGLARGRCPLATTTIVWVFVFFGLGIPFALAHGLIVAWRSEVIAGDRPYCIQYASQTDPFAYEPARTLFDLSAFKMQARLMAGGSTTYHFQHHALLVVGNDTPRLFNWSYVSEGFVDEVLNRKLFQDPAQRRYAPSVYCQPKKHYAKLLPLWWHVPSDVAIAIGVRSFSIPESYRPRQMGDAFVIDVTPPDFAPYDPNRRPARLQFYSDIRIAKEESADLAPALAKRIAAFSQAKSAAPEFDLDKTELYVRSNRGSLSNEPIVMLYAGRDDTGRVRRVIDCGSGFGMRGRPCQYVFLADGLRFSLMLPYPADWKETERALAAIVASFEVKPGP